ncbi:MAG: hypothetical protein AAGD06_16605 [Acidobacteriota bacterium]
MNDPQTTTLPSCRALRVGGFLLVALMLAFAAPSLLASDGAQGPIQGDVGFAIEDPVTTPEAPSLDGEALPGVVPATIICRERCSCVRQETPPTTRVGATCLRARQNAAAAARQLAVCPSNSNGKCRNTTHSVAPCQTLSTGGFSATAVATYWCEFCVTECDDICQDVQNPDV